MANLEQLIVLVVLGRTTGAEGAGVVAAALLTGSGSGPAILWADPRDITWVSQPIVRQALSWMSCWHPFSMTSNTGSSVGRSSAGLSGRRDVAGRTSADGRSLAARQEGDCGDRALVAASTQPMAVSMEVMNLWHGLVTEVGAWPRGSAPLVLLRHPADCAAGAGCCCRSSPAPDGFSPVVRRRNDRLWLGMRPIQERASPWRPW